MLFLEVCAVLVIWLTFWSLIPRDEWWIRGADFPRLQILALGAVVLLAYALWDAPWTLPRELILILLIAAIAYQLKMVLPYTFLWKKQVLQVPPELHNPSHQIALLISNVLESKHY